MSLQHYKFYWVFFLFFSLFSSCGHDNSPEGVAKEFLFRYFIELNQRGALELSEGLAVKKLEKEIELLQSVRMEPNLDLASHKPFLDYNLVNSQQRGESYVTFYYDITIENKSGTEYKRELVLTTSLSNGRWKVSNFDTFVKN